MQPFQNYCYVAAPLKVMLLNFYYFVSLQRTILHTSVVPFIDLSRTLRLTI